MNAPRIFFLLFAISSLFLFSCKKSPTKIIVKGSWVVSLYKEDFKDETSDFDSYIFDFNNDGTLVVTQPNGAISLGSWSFEDNPQKYRITISGTPKLDKINDVWLVTKISNSLIELEDDSPSKNEVLNLKRR